MNLADHGVRKYDSDLGRFICPDAMWEKYISYSPYHYCRNNPINAIDFNGLDDGAFGSWMQVGPTQELILGDKKVDTYQEVVENSEKPENKQLIKTWAEIGVMGLPVGRAVKAILNAGIELSSGGDDAKGETNVIKGFKQHAVDQAISRGFTTTDILKIVKEGNSVQAKGRHGPQTRYTLGGNTVIVNAQGEVVTVYSNAPGTEKGLGKGFFIPFK